MNDRYERRAQQLRTALETMNTWPYACTKSLVSRILDQVVTRPTLQIDPGDVAEKLQRLHAKIPDHAEKVIRQLTAIVECQPAEKVRDGYATLSRLVTDYSLMTSREKNELGSLLGHVSSLALFASIQEKLNGASCHNYVYHAACPSDAYRADTRNDRGKHVKGPERGD